jgi:hypothetical protein
MDDPSSKSTWSKKKYISFKRYQMKSVLLLYASLSTTFSPKIATDSSDPKASHSSIKTRYFWYHSVDIKYFLLHVKFEASLLSLLRENPCPAKSGTFSWGDGPSFFSEKIAFLKFDNFFVFWNWKMPGTHGTCVDRVIKTH